MGSQQASACTACIVKLISKKVQRPLQTRLFGTGRPVAGSLSKCCRQSRPIGRTLPLGLCRQMQEGLGNAVNPACQFIEIGIEHELSSCADYPLFILSTANALPRGKTAPCLEPLPERSFQ
ncbi:hypothetical protein DFO50_10270 [Microvirgula sp. AG722]|nr:hypothetical protein DFO50_10270 [Microvirgula sp. AG722]